MHKLNWKHVIDQNKQQPVKISLNPSQAAIKILINATVAGFICKNIFSTAVQVKKN